MAQININEISQNYLWSVGTSTFATVALPITSSWGPGLFNSELMGSDVDDADLLEKVAWQRFPSTQAGLESFIIADPHPTIVLQKTSHSRWLRRF